MKFTKMIAVLGALFLCVILAGCSKAVPPGTYDSSEVGKMKRVVPGVVLSKRYVNIENRNAINPAREGVAEVDNAAGHSRGIEYVIKLNSGMIVSLVQVDDLDLNPKQRVLVIYGQNTRVVADEGAAD